MKNEIEELIEQMDEIIDPMMVMARGLYRKMGENKELWSDLAKCYKTAVDSLVEAGFSREEAISITVASLNNLGSKK